MSTNYDRLKDPFTNIVMREYDTVWDIYYKSPKEIDPPAFEGEQLFATFDLSKDDDEILYDILINLFFGNEEIDRVCHISSGGEEKGRCLRIYDPFMPDDTLLLSEYGHIIRLKELKKECQTITVKEKY